MKDKKKWLTWFTDFMYADIDTLGDAKRVAFMLEIYSLLGHGDRGYTKHPKHSAPPWTEIAQRFDLEKTQSSVRDFFEHITEKIERIRAYEGTSWKRDTEIDFRPFLQSVQTTVKMDMEVKAPYEHKSPSAGQHLFRYPKGSIERGVITTSYGVDTNEAIDDAVLFSFSQLLDGVPLASFKQCPECEHWFINLSKKEKLFCSNQCAARYGVRRKRKEAKKAASASYRKQLESSKVRARKSYESRIRKMHPKAVIGKRPRKNAKD